MNLAEIKAAVKAVKNDQYVLGSRESNKYYHTSTCVYCGKEIHRKVLFENVAIGVKLEFCSNKCKLDWIRGFQLK